MAVRALFRKIADVPAVPGHELLTTNVAVDGAALLLYLPQAAADAAFARSPTPGVPPYPSKTARPVASARLARLHDGRTDWLDLTEVDAMFPEVDTLPGGEVVIVGCRCQLPESGPAEPNASVYDSSGRRVRRFLMGDGIQHMQADAQGRIWAGYFDEGVFGNYGWGSGGPDRKPIGASGLVCFDASGGILWRFTVPGDSIADAYAMNVAEASTHVYYYMTFDVAEIGEGFTVKPRAVDLAGARRFAVSPTHYLFTGGYNDPHDTAYLFARRGDALERIAEVTLALPNGGELGQFPRLVNRGRFLHLIDERGWFALDIGDVVLG